MVLARYVVVKTVFILMIKKVVVPGFVASVKANRLGVVSIWCARQWAKTTDRLHCWWLRY
jgi:hypothetical protein